MSVIRSTKRQEDYQYGKLQNVLSMIGDGRYKVRRAFLKYEIYHEKYPSSSWWKRLLSISDKRKVADIGIHYGIGSWNMSPAYYIDIPSEAEKEIINLAQELEKHLKMGVTLFL